MRYARAAWVVCGCLATATAAAGSDKRGPARIAERPSTLTAERIRSGLAESQSRLTAYCITYRIDPPAPFNATPGSYLMRTVAARAPDRFFHETAHGDALRNWTADPARRRSFISGTAAVDEWVNNRSYNFQEIAPRSPLPGSLPTEFLIHATGLWPLLDRPAPRLPAGPLVLREVAESVPHEHVRPALEERDGRWCHVLEIPGLDALWIDAERGFALMARETRDPASGALVERLALGGHVACGDGLWFPRWIHNEQFDFRADTEAARARRVIDARLDLLDVKVNAAVEEELFDFRPAPGSLWLDPPEGRPVQTTPDGEDLLDWFAEHLGSPPAVPQRNAGSLARHAAAVAAALLLLELILRGTRRRRQGPSRPETSSTLPR